MTTYTLYTLTASIANDRAAPHDMVVVSAGLLFLYCVGAIASPALASELMRQIRPAALYWQNGLLHGALALFALAVAGETGSVVSSPATVMSGASGCFMPTTW